MEAGHQQQKQSQTSRYLEINALNNYPKFITSSECDHKYPFIEKNTMQVVKRFAKHC